MVEGIIITYVCIFIFFRVVYYFDKKAYAKGAKVYKLRRRKEVLGNTIEDLADL